MDYTPDNHSLYWIYGHDPQGYNFDTTPTIVEAKKIYQDFIQDGWDEVYIWYGDENRAFTELDPYLSFIR